MDETEQLKAELAATRERLAALTLAARAAAKALDTAGNRIADEWPSGGRDEWDAAETLRKAVKTKR